MDADSTLLQDEVIDLLAVECGCAAEVSEITELRWRARSTSLKHFDGASPCSRDYPRVCSMT